MFRLEVPHQYEKLLAPARYKVYYGGRYGCKDWSFVRALLFLASLYDPQLTPEQVDSKVKIFTVQTGFDGALIRRSLTRPHRIMCGREIQKSIDESIYTLIKDQIHTLNLDSIFKVNKTSIDCINGSNFFFEGLLRNVHNIKSLEGVTICAVFEGENVSATSWRELIPTIRYEGSEVWVSFNTRYADDPTYERFVTNANQSEGSIVEFINSTDVEQYLTDTIRKERAADYVYRPQEAKNIWGGQVIGVGRKLYPDFKESLHVKDFDLRSIAGAAQCYMSIDPAMHYYPACLWLARFPDADGNIVKYVYDEWPGRDDLGDWFHAARTTMLYTGTLADMARAIYAHDGVQYGLRIIKRGIDTRFIKGTGSASYYSGDTVGLVGEFAKRENGGLQFSPPWEKAIDMALNKITTDLQYNTTLEISAFNRPTLYVSPRCQNLILSLKNHRLEEGAEKESARYKDFSDALKIMYAVMDDKYTDKNGISLDQEQSPFLFCGVGAASQHDSLAWMKA